MASDVFFNHSPPLFLRQGLSLSLETTNELLSPLLQSWEERRKKGGKEVLGKHKS